MKFLYGLWRAIVGDECGYVGESIGQWYYTAALGINIMLVWWLKPEIALVFTILMVIHYATVFLYGLRKNTLCETITKETYIYIGIHLVLLIVGLFVNFLWALITSAIVAFSYDLAGRNEESALNHQGQPYDNFALMLNTVVFVAFAVVDFLLPIKLWIRFVILAIAIIVHYLTDEFMEPNCIGHQYITVDIYDKIKEIVKMKRNIKQTN